MKAAYFRRGLRDSVASAIARISDQFLPVSD
jgi:hypothetical protein